MPNLIRRCERTYGSGGGGDRPFITSLRLPEALTLPLPGSGTDFDGQDRRRPRSGQAGDDPDHVLRFGLAMAEPPHAPAILLQIVGADLDSVAASFHRCRATDLGQVAISRSRFRTPPHGCSSGSGPDGAVRHDAPIHPAAGLGRRATFSGARSRPSRPRCSRGCG